MVNKKKRVGLIAAAAVAALVVTSPGTALAATSITVEDTGYTVEGTPSSLRNGWVDGATAAGTEIGTPAEIEVNAKVNSSTEIVYNVTIDYGAMEFDYNYGSSWNPTTHTYSSGSQVGGWDVTKVSGANSATEIVNNGIRITNNSNFPVTVAFSYDDSGTALNANKTASGSVVGIFGTSNNTLANLLDKGYGISSTYTPPTSITLEMDHSKLDLTQYHYYYSSSTGNATNKYFDDIYFALSGKPDQGLQGLATYVPVGTIKFTIKPAIGATKVPSD